MRLFTPSKGFLFLAALTASTVLPSKHSAQNGSPSNNCCTAETQSGKHIAYTVILQEYLTQANGSVLPTIRMTVAVRGDGSRVMEFTSTNDPEKPSSERIVDYSSGEKMYVLENDRRTSTTFDPTRTITRWLPDPRNNCLVQGLDEQFAGEEIVNGYRTAKLTGGPAARWLALDYGCAVVKERADWGNGESSKKRMVALTLGEPSPSLFDHPAGFEEVPLSKLFPGSLSGPQQEVEEKYYYSHRPLELMHVVKFSDETT